MSLADDLRAIEVADLDGLRAIWERRHGAIPPLRSAPLLRRILAWRIQAAREGGLDPQCRKLLRASGSGPRLATGAIVAREWQGERHEVEVAEDGFLYAGARWSSLSEIARHITGTRWNGPRFFGLRT